MPFEFVRYEKRDRIAYVTINRPEVMNALHPPANDELSAVWDDFAADPDTWVAILTGGGGGRAPPAAPRAAQDRDGDDADGAADPGRRGGAHRARERGGAAGAADGRGGALGERDPRVLAALGAGLQAGGAPGSGEAARRGDGGRLPTRAEALDERGRRR